MLEKIIDLEDINLAEFMGVENANMREISKTFPTSKIIARGNEIVIKGTETEVRQIENTLELIKNQLLRTGKITKDQIGNFINQEKSSVETLLDDDLILIGTKGVVIKAKTANQIKMVEAVRAHDIVFATGPAGTGKTYTAVALAVKALKDKVIKKIIITRPAVEAGENLGFLPGDLKEKIDPYLRPIYDALEDMIQAEKLKFYLENKTIEIAPLAYMRGRTLNNAFILLDEAQNTTPMQIKMFLTRMGPNSKTIITGDRSQVDLPTKQKSGLSEAIRILGGIQGIGFIELDGKDVLRHRLVRDILEAYQYHESQDA